MATIRVCDRCNREIFEKNNKTLLAADLSANTRDLCLGCFKSFQQWWKEGHIRPIQDSDLPVGDPRRESILPGWTCPKCGVFNGEAKETRLDCRSCSAPYEGPFTRSGERNRGA